MKYQLQLGNGPLDQWVNLAQKEGFSFEYLETFSASSEAIAARIEMFSKEDITAGMIQSVHGAFIDVNPASGDPLFRALSRQRCRESCEIAQKLGAKNVVFHSSAFPFLRGGYLQNWAQSCASFYEELVQGYSVDIYIENAQDLDPAPLRLLMDKISNQHIGVCLDIGHANYSRSSLQTWFDTLQDRIGYLHLSDNLGQFDDHLPLGDGGIDWKSVDRCLEQLDKDLVVTFETGSPQQTEASIRFLRRCKCLGLR